MIRLIISDINGVWTDGRLIYSGETREIKEFNVRDGLGVKLAQNGGVAVAVVTSRRSKALARRCRELGIEEVVQGSADKLAEVARISRRLHVPLEETCYVGDDLPDLAAMKVCGLSAAPSDASTEVLAVATLHLQAAGGRGALREVVEHILRENGTWETVLAEFQS